MPIVVCFVQCRHVIFAPNMFNSNDGSTFPGLSDLIQQIIRDEQSGSGEDARWNDVRKHYAAIIQCVDVATSSLRPVTDFMPAGVQ